MVDVFSISINWSIWYIPMGKSMFNVTVNILLFEDGKFFERVRNYFISNI